MEPSKLKATKSYPAPKAVIAVTDIDQNGGLAQKFAVTAVPTMVLFKDGKPIDTLKGKLPKNVIMQKLNAAMA